MAKAGNRPRRKQMKDRIMAGLRRTKARAAALACAIAIAAIAAAAGIESIGGGFHGGWGGRVRVPDGCVLCDKCGGRRTVECISCRGKSQGRKCIRCDGNGVVKCGRCNGAGYVKERRQATPARPQRTRGGSSSEASRRADRNALKQKLEAQKEFLRAFVRDNDIVCTSRVQLAEMNLALLRKCAEEDKAIRALAGESGFTAKFATDLHQVLGAGPDSADDEKCMSIISFSDGSPDELADALKSQHAKELSGLEKPVAKPEYYKKFCDVHKWDDECCPRFGADYFTEDMKTKYASNKMQAYEMQKKGVIKCTCDAHMRRYEEARREYEKEVLRQKRAVEEATSRYLKLRQAVLEFRNGRIEAERKLRAMEKADETFGVIADLVKSIKSR